MADTPRALPTLVPQADAPGPPPAPARSVEEGVVAMLARSLEGQTTALVNEVRTLSSDLRAELRSLRTWGLGAFVVLILALAAIAGAGAHVDLPGIGSLTTTAAASPGPGAPTPAPGVPAPPTNPTEAP